MSTQAEPVHDVALEKQDADTWLAEKVKEYFAEHPEIERPKPRDEKKHVRRMSMYKYGKDTPEWYEKTEKEQGGLCAICHRKPDKPLVIDHCHKSGVRRGLLCYACNVALGFLEDNIDTLLTAIVYLRKTEEQRNAM